MKHISQAWAGFVICKCIYDNNTAAEAVHIETDAVYRRIFFAAASKNNVAAMQLICGDHDVADMVLAPGKAVRCVSGASPGVSDSSRELLRRAGL